MPQTSTSNALQSTSLTNYCAFLDPARGTERVGHLDEVSQTIQPLAFKSGTYLSNLYQVIQVGEHGIIPTGDPLPRSYLRLLPPISGRDILCVGKNYSEHAKEFNKSGFDSSDKVDQPTHPVIFSKRFTSIVADRDEIYPHPEFTQTADYEGELGVIVGKQGFRIGQDEAMDHVWGYTIINDVTARERQRDHKQFYIGKSPDTFCPMGPIAVPAHKVDKILRVQTHVNGELRQDATTDDLIFSIPYLLMTMSEGQTLMPGDVLATGTPAGVGIGRSPPVYLKAGDGVSVSVSGLGRLTNRIASIDSQNPTAARLEDLALPRTPRADQYGLTMIGNKPLHVKQLGNQNGQPAIFIHGLGGTIDYWTPLVASAKLSTSHNCLLFDLEGHGLSPTTPLSKLSITSFADDLKSLSSHYSIQNGLTVVAHSIGCLIALKLAQDNPGLVAKLVLLGPPPSPLSLEARREFHAAAALVRTEGMGAVVDVVSIAGTSQKTQSSNHLALSTVRLSLLGQSAEGYAKACSALAEATTGLDLESVDAKTLIINGAEDKVSTAEVCDGYRKALPNAELVEVLEDVGHWHVFEDLEGVSRAVGGFL